MIQYRLLVFLCGLGLVASTLLRAQCPEEGRVGEVLQESDLQTYYSLVAQLKDCQQHRDSFALVLHKMGTLHYVNDALDSAANYTERALNLWNQLPKQEARGKSAFNLGYFLILQGLYRQSIPHLEYAVELFDELDIGVRLRRSYGQLSQAYTRVGAYQKAQAVIALALIYDEAEGREESLAGTYLNKGLLHIKQRQYAEAIAVLQKADAIYRQFPVSTNHARTIHNLAWASDELGRTQEAEQEYLRALSLYRSLNECQDIANSSNTLGFFYVENDQLSKALPFIEAGLRAAKSCGLVVNMAQSYDHFGEFYLVSGRSIEAIEAFQKAQQLLVPAYEPTSMTDVPTTAHLDQTANPLDLFIYLNDQVRALEQCLAQDDCKISSAAVLTVFQRADELIDLIRSGHLNADTKLFWRREVLPFYERAVAFCHRFDLGTEAFYFFEKSKSVLLLEGLLDNDALLAIPDSLQRVEMGLSNRLHELQEAIRLEPESQQEKYKELLREQQALESFRERVRTQYPTYRELTQHLPIPEPEAFYASHLQPIGKTLVHYLWGTERVYALTLNENGIQTYDLGPSTDLQESTAAVLAFFHEPGLIEQDPQAFASAAFALHQQLVAPLQLKPGTGLLLVSDGPLTYLPFVALVTAEPTADMLLSTIPYLIHQHSIQYSYSASILLRQSQTQMGASSTITAFAPFADGHALVDYPMLDFSGDELEHISRSFACEIWKNEEASLQQWRELATGASILHLSTHAFSSPAEQSPHIAFYDSLLQLRSIYQYSIPAQLVVLSACQTQIGRLAPGEGVLGLGRAFVQAGAASVVASLWNVNAQSTGRILADFYTALATRMQKDQALHQAQLNYLLSPEVPTFQKSPYYWAAFGLHGSTDTLALKTATPWHYILLGASGILLLGLLFWRWRRS